MMPTLRGAAAVERAREVGARLFAEHGYSETTTRQLSAAIGITNGTFYHHFSSKEDLLRRVSEGALAEIDAAVRAAIADVNDPVQRVETLVRTHLSVIAGSKDAHTVMLVELRALRGTNREVVIAARDAYENIVKDVVEHGQVAGELRRDLDGATLARLLLNLMNWTIFWFEPDGDLSVDELADRMLAVFLDGARTP